MLNLHLQPLVLANNLPTENFKGYDVRIPVQYQCLGLGLLSENYCIQYALKVSLVAFCGEDSATPVDE